MRTATPDVHGRIAGLIRADARNGSEWALLLGLGRQAMHDRLKLRTRWTLCDAVTIAAALGTTLDDLVGDEDLELGYELTPSELEELPDVDPFDHAAELLGVPRAELLDAEDVAAEVAALHLHPVPDYDEVDR